MRNYGIMGTDIYWSFRYFLLLLEISTSAFLFFASLSPVFFPLGLFFLPHILFFLPHGLFLFFISSIITSLVTTLFEREIRFFLFFGSTFWIMTVGARISLSLSSETSFLGFWSFWIRSMVLSGGMTHILQPLDKSSSRSSSNNTRMLFMRSNQMNQRRINWK